MSSKFHSGLEVAHLGLLFLDPVPDEEHMLQYVRRCRDAGCVLPLSMLAYVWSVANVLMLEGQMKDAEATMLVRQWRLKEKFAEERAPKQDSSETHPSTWPEPCADGCTWRLIDTPCPICEPEPDPFECDECRSYGCDCAGEEEEKPVTIGEAFAFMNLERDQYSPTIGEHEWTKD